MTQPMLVRVVIASLAVLTAACADAPVSAPAAKTTSLEAFSGNQSFIQAQAATDRVIVELKGAEGKDFGGAVQKLGGRVERRHAEANFVVASGMSAAAIASLASRSDVASVTHDARVQWIPTTAAAQRRHGAPGPHVTGPDQSGACFWDFQWNMRVSRAADAWTTTPAGDGTTVYVLDSGIDPGHLDLDGRVDVSKSKSFAEAEPDDINDYNTHGTFVSAIVASNGICVASVAPLTRIVGVKVLDASGSGSFSDVISGIIYAADQGADVINMSLGAMADLSIKDWRTLVRYLQAAIAYANRKGAVVVAAAGNGDENFVGIQLTAIPRNFVFVPAELDGVVSVGATAPVNQQNFDRLASYSNYGWSGNPFQSGVQMFAPGGDFVDGSSIFDLVISACSEFVCPGNDFYFLDAGTSAATPIVSGAAAVARSLLGGPRNDTRKTVECLLQGADKIGPRAIFGFGRVNVVNTASCASRGRRGIAD